MVNSVMFTRENDVIVLQNLNPHRQAEICMGPFVNLNDKNQQSLTGFRFFIDLPGS